MVDFGVLRTLPCALLLAEILTLLISFVAMATQESFSNSSSMQYLLAMGIITFVVCLALLVGGYMMGLFSITAFAEACVYLFFAVMIFIGFLAGAVACNRSGSPCKTSGTSAHANVSIAFAFFATLELLVSAWVAYGAHQVGGGMGTQAEGGGYVGGYA